MRRPEKVDLEPPSELDLAEEPVFGEVCPRLLEHLTCRVWDDGTPRETSTLLLFTEEGRWKCCFNDRALGRQAFVTGATLEGLLLALERGVESDGLDWRRRREGGPDGKKRR